MPSTAQVARCLLRRHRKYADRHWLYLGMGWGLHLYHDTLAWYLWRVAQRSTGQVREVALLLHERTPHC
jgi:hypothetical protein